YLADWSSQRQKEFKDLSSLGHDLDLAIRPQVAHLTQESRWPLPYALGNIVRQLKKEIMKIGSTDGIPRFQGIEDIRKWLDDCEEEYFGSAYRAISGYLLGKMKTAPNVITYDWCPLVNKVLLDSIENGSQTVFTVVDPEIEGRGLRHIRSFVERNIRCRYTDLNSLGAVMKNGSMVLLGCAAVLSNGCVVAPKGSILLALAAKAFNVPVLIVSQTFKFIDKVQACSRVALLGRESLELVPSDLVTAIVTDIRMLPPTSVPAVLKAKALDLE
ncbi:initiation factor, subunit 2 family protein, partial [Necator americanus]